MENKYKNLGKVRPTVEGDWDIGKSYKVLSIVFDEASNKSYISIKDVPKGISILNKKYWGRFGNNRIDSDSIILLSRKNENGDINTYTLEEAINSISIGDRRIGLFISFYEKPIDANSNYRWNMYQFNSNDINDWGNLEAWSSIYYVKTKFFGLQVNEEALYYVRKNPDVGDYAFVGDTLKDAVIYRCYGKNIWKRTEESAVDYLSIILKGNITIGSNGNWFQDNIDTGIKAQGPAGKDATLEDFFSSDSINGVQNKVIDARFNELENIVFPLEVTFTSNKLLLEYTGSNQSIELKFKITRREQYVAPDKVTITKDSSNIYSGIDFAKTVETTVNKKGNTSFNLEVIYKDLNVSKSLNVNMVLPIYFGFSNLIDIASLDITTLNKQSIKTSPNGTYILNNSVTGNYLWLCVPDNMTINKVTSSGFDFPIESYVTKSTSLGNYKCYRSSSQINQGNVTILIS